MAGDKKAIKLKIPIEKGASNKPHIQPKFDIGQQQDQAFQLNLKPFIDRLTININPLDKDQHDIHDAFWTAVADPELLQDALSAEKKGGVPGFNVAKRIILSAVDAEKKRPTLFVRDIAQAKRIAKMRLDFVPVDLGPEGIAELHVAMNMLVPDGWEYVVKHGRITRIDIAVDLPGLTMDSVHFLPKKPAHTQRLFPDGQIETIYIGKPKSNQIAIYDRSKKRAKLGQEVPQCLRIERRLKPSGLKMSSLAGVTNPFADTKFIIALPSPPESAKEKEWSLFSDSVEKRGLSAALALLPKDRRNTYKKHLSANALPGWDPEQIWSNWNPMLEELKITSAHW